MQLRHKSLCNVVGALLAFFALTVMASAQEATGQAAANQIKIKNFGQMDERFYRGAQPTEEDFKDLAALGIKTIIDLRADPKDYEKSIVESLGMKYVNIPMIGKKYPTREAVESFLKVVNDPSTGSFFVHCAGGRHRTGAMGAVYRYTKYGWTFEQVYEEMKKFDFYTSWGHGAFKDFVQDYYALMQANKPPASAAPVNAAPVNAAQATAQAVTTQPATAQSVTSAPVNVAPAKATAVTIQATDAIRTSDSLAIPK